MLQISQWKDTYGRVTITKLKQIKKYCSNWQWSNLSAKTVKFWVSEQAERSST